MPIFNFGENLRDIRLLKGISQDAMARNLQITQTRYSKMERYSIIPEEIQISDIARVLDVPSADLLAPLDELESATAVSSSTLASKSEIILRGPIRKLLILLAAFLIVNIVYSAVKGAASGFGASDKTMIIVGLSAVLLSSIYIYYWIRKMKIW